MPAFLGATTNDRARLAVGRRVGPPGRFARAAMERFAAAPLLLVVAPAWIAGDLLAAGTAAPPSTVGSAVAAVALIALPHRAGRRAGMLLLSFLIAWLAADRVYRPHLPADHIAQWAPRRYAALEATLTTDGEKRGRGGRLWIAGERIGTAEGERTVQGAVLVNVREMGRRWRVGDRVRLRVSIRAPRNFGNPGELDYRAYLARRGVYVTGFLAADRDIELLDRPDSGVGPAFARWRRGVGGLFGSVLPPAPAALLGALIVGTANELPADVRAAFTATGVAHVLSISGLHVGLVAAAGYAAFRWLLARSRSILLTGAVPRLAVGAAVAGVLMYAGIAGTSVATLRAVIMVVVVLGAVVCDRQRHLLVSLAAAALGLLIWSPGASMDISFQLSFVAVLVLVVGMERFGDRWRAHEETTMASLRGWRVRLERATAMYLAVSVLAFLATAPLTALHFNQVTPVSLVANAVVVPLLGGATVILGLLGAVAYLVWEPLARFFVLLAWPGLALGLGIVDALARIPYAVWRVVTPTGIELAILYGALGSAVLLRGRRRSGALILLALAMAIDAGWWYGERYLHDDLRVTFLSVGQADCAVVELPGGDVLVIDAGGLGDTFDTGERLVAPFLWQRKIGRIDYLVLSHAQWDHYGGLAFLAQQFAPRELWWNGQAASGARFAALRRVVGEQGAVERVLARGATRQLGAVVATVVSPEGGALSGRLNDDSLVLRLSFGTRHVLFPGDIEAGGERALLQRPATELGSTVVKVPHHGSRTSSTAGFVDATAPALAVVSAGFGNPFGFPHRDVVRRYGSRGATILRTDTDGAVAVRIDPAGTVVVRSHRYGHIRTFGAPPADLSLTADARKKGAWRGGFGLNSERFAVKVSRADAPGARRSLAGRSAFTPQTRSRFR